jgi:hypothetical protein
MKQAVKRIVFGSPRPRRLPLGLARGIRMHIDFATQTHHYFGLYEAELNRHLRPILRRGVRSFDIGVQHGYDSLLIAQRTGAPVAAFERDEACFEEMERNFALNPQLEPLIRPVHGTVGNGAGEIGLDQWAYHDGFVPDFIKLDIECGELSALRSAERLLEARKPSLVIEVHTLELERECGRLLTRHGYRPAIVNPRRLLPDHRPDAHNRWLIAVGDVPGNAPGDPNSS